jgi:regulator of RNase E activity RraB
MSQQVTLRDADANHERDVEVSTGETIRVKDGPRIVYITLETDGRLRVEMIDEYQNGIVLEENNQPNLDNTNALMGDDNPPE